MPPPNPPPPNPPPPRLLSPTHPPITNGCPPGWPPKPPPPPVGLLIYLKTIDPDHKVSPILLLLLPVIRHLTEYFTTDPLPESELVVIVLLQPVPAATPSISQIRLPHCCAGFVVATSLIPDWFLAFARK